MGHGTVLSPITPPMSAASDRGTRGAAVLTRATRPPGRRASTSGTAKACSIVATVPVTGIIRPSGATGPTSSPTDASHVLTAATVAGRGAEGRRELPAVLR